MELPGYGLVLLYSSTVGPAFLGIPLHRWFSLQDRVETSIPEVHTSSDSLPNLIGPVDARHFFQDNVGEY